MNAVKVATSIVCGVLFASGTAWANEIDVDMDTGVIYGVAGFAEAAIQKGPPTGACILTVPAVVANGEVFTATVSYAVPTPAGNRFERFEFKWASICAAFTEKTELEKAYTPGDAGVVASFESIVVPDATCINGTFEAQVKVKGAVNCKANAMMTVIPE